MAWLSISFPEALKEYVEGQVASAAGALRANNVCELIRQDKERRFGRF